MIESISSYIRANIECFALSPNKILTIKILQISLKWQCPVKSKRKGKGQE